MRTAREVDWGLLAKLDRQWTEATGAVARAQREYQELQASADTDERAEDRAWLELWKAERRKCEVLVAMDAVDSMH